MNGRLGIKQGEEFMSRRLRAILLATAALMMVSVPAHAEFVTTDQGVVYQTSAGIVTGLQKVGDYYYLFDTEGRRLLLSV